MTKKGKKPHLGQQRYMDVLWFSQVLQRKFNDFNDLHKNYGIDAVKEQLTSNLLQAPLLNDELKNLASNLLKKEEPCANFYLDLLPKELKNYILSICETTDAHPIMITCSVLSMVSAYLNTRVFIPEGEYSRNLYPNLWLLCISDSGNFKTTALNKGAKIAYKNKSNVTREICELKKNLKREVKKMKK